MQNQYKTFIFTIIFVFLFIDYASSNTSANNHKKLYEFYKTRNVMAGKVMTGLYSNIKNPAGPTGEMLVKLDNSNAKEEFCKSIEIMNYHEDQMKILNRAEKIKKKGK